MQIKINSLISPFIDTPPRFSWSLAPLASQVAYTLTVAKDESFETPVFSVREVTDERANVKHDIQLLPHTKYFVRVVAELENGETETGETEESWEFSSHKKTSTRYANLLTADAYGYLYIASGSNVYKFTEEAFLAFTEYTRRRQ